MNRADRDRGTTPPAPRLAGDAAEARRVVEADERWLAAFNRADVAALVALYDPEVVVMPPDGPDLHGREAVAAWLRRFFAGNAARQVLLHEEVVAESGRAVLRGRYELRTTPRGGGPPALARGKHLVVWRRGPDGAWRAWRDIWNEAPAATAPPAD